MRNNLNKIIKPFINEQIENEEWVLIPDTVSAISSKGRIFNLSTCQFKKPIVNKNGYEQVNLYLLSLNTSFSIAVHRLVAQLFINNDKQKEIVDHIDTVRNNNSVENLRWVTQIENMNNPITKNRVKYKKGAIINPLYHIKENVYMIDTHNDEILNVFENAQEAASALNLYENRWYAIQKVCLVHAKLMGTTGSLTAYGYKWEFTPNIKNNNNFFKK